jgi:hypothetical protein
MLTGKYETKEARLQIAPTRILLLHDFEVQIQITEDRSQESVLLYLIMEKSTD